LARGEDLVYEREERRRIVAVDAFGHCTIRLCVLTATRHRTIGDRWQIGVPDVYGIEVKSIVSAGLRADLAGAKRVRDDVGLGRELIFSGLAE